MRELFREHTLLPCDDFARVHSVFSTVFLNVTPASAWTESATASLFNAAIFAPRIARPVTEVANASAEAASPSIRLTTSELVSALPFEKGAFAIASLRHSDGEYRPSVQAVDVATAYICGAGASKWLPRIPSRPADQTPPPWDTQSSGAAPLFPQLKHSLPKTGLIGPSVTQSSLHPTNRPRDMSIFCHPFWLRRLPEAFRR